MVAYRAETAMASLLREHLSRKMDARTLRPAIYNTEADLIPDHLGKTLTVRLHHLANRAESIAMKKLCENLNETESIFPGTEYRIIYELGSA